MSSADSHDSASRLLPAKVEIGSLESHLGSPAEPAKGGLRGLPVRSPTLRHLGGAEIVEAILIVCTTGYQQSLRRYHQRHVRARSLCVDDLVLRRVQTRAGLSKLSPMWEGPYRVIGVPRPGSVRLATGDGTELPNPWNIEHLRRFYP
uniref:Retroelement n=1 Tax=Oryza sativa subsp. japonica TaxID=39947 RepID=Q94HT5_ORYSJ|nr:Putative retroelement [Oryza sativa Japonica Group]